MKTARYLNPNINPEIHTPVRISLGVPKFRIGYEIAGSVELLMPTPQMLSLDDEAVYRKLYFELLNHHGIRAIVEALQAVTKPGKETILLGFEDLRKPDTWCHRRMFADWIKRQTGRTIDELEEREPNETQQTLWR